MSEWDTPRLRLRPTFSTPAPPPPHEPAADACPNPSPWPRTPSIPWYDRPSATVSATPFSGPSAPSTSGPSAPSGSTAPPTSSTIRYLRLAFQETPPKLKELEEGWRIARRAAARPAPVVVVERAERKGERALRSAMKGRARDERRDGGERRVSGEKRDGEQERAREAAREQDGPQDRAERRERWSGEPRDTPHPRDKGKGRATEDPIRKSRETDVRELSITERYDLLRVPRAARAPAAAAAKPEGGDKGGKGDRTRPAPEEHSVGQSTGLLTPPASPAPQAARRAKGAPRLPVRFVSPPPTSADEPESGPSGPSAPGPATGPSLPSQPSRPSEPPADDTPTPAARPALRSALRPLPTLRVMSATMPHDVPPSVVCDPSPLEMPDLPRQHPTPYPSRVARSEPPQPAPAKRIARERERDTAPKASHHTASRPSHSTAPQPSHPTPPQPSHPAAAPPPPNTAPTASGPAPIRVQPLPPTRHPDPLSRKTSDTIVVHPPDSDIALTLNLRRQTAHVKRSGDEVTIEGRAPQVLRLADIASWSPSQREQWDLLARLVTEYKRRTPRVKVFTGFGELVVTCCEPPDIVLSYLADESATKATTKVRLRYSLSSFEAVLDTSMRRPRGARDETHRARRSIPLRWSGEGERAALALGVDFGEWDAAEKDAVRRLWALREDWARFVPGYTQ